jgi:hypothetical protein
VNTRVSIPVHFVKVLAIVVFPADDPTRRSKRPVAVETINAITYVESKLHAIPIGVVLFEVVPTIIVSEAAPKRTATDIPGFGRSAGFRRSAPLTDGTARNGRGWNG